MGSPLLKKICVEKVRILLNYAVKLNINSNSTNFTEGI